jgi:hypothetical protein
MALGTILWTLSKDTDLYNSLSTGNNGPIPSGHINNCWNCNGDHGVKMEVTTEPSSHSGQQEEVGRRKEEEEEVWIGSGSGGSGSG